MNALHFTKVLPVVALALVLPAWAVAPSDQAKTNAASEASPQANQPASTGDAFGVPSTSRPTTYGTPQMPDTTKPSQVGESTPSTDREAQAAEQLRTAQLKRNEENAEKRGACLHDAEEAYERVSSSGS
jgi:hypothetical protein